MYFLAPAEVPTGAPSAGLFDIDVAVDELERDGVTVLRGLLDRSLLDTWAVAFAELFERRRRRPGGMAERGPGRYYLTLPFTQPFADATVYANPVVRAVLDRVLDHDYVMVQLATDTPVRGSQQQEVHRDFRHLFPERFTTPLYAVAVNVPLCDVGAHNGPFLIARGTHLLPREVAEGAIASGDIELEAVELGMGDVMIRTPYALHCGSPNVTDTPRPMVVAGYVRRWLYTPHLDLEVPRAAYEALDDDLRALLRCRVVEQLEERPETYVEFQY